MSFFERCNGLEVQLFLQKAIQRRRSPSRPLLYPVAPHKCHSIIIAVNSRNVSPHARSVGPWTQAPETAFRHYLVRTGHHIAAPTNAANVKKSLANPEPSTHGT